MLYTVTYKYNAETHCNWFGFIKPWNAVRDSETYSLTYCPPSMIGGLELRLCKTGKIVRHKLKYDTNGQASEQTKTVRHSTDYKIKSNSIHTRHLLVNPELILAFNNKEDAINASNIPIWIGQSEYTVPPFKASLKDNVVKEMTEEEFDNLKGSETFISDEKNGIFCGFNRQKNNEKMYITITNTNFED